MTITIDHLPVEILSLIFDQLSTPEKFTLRLLNRQTNALLSEPRYGLFETFHLKPAQVLYDSDTQQTNMTTYSTLALQKIYNSALRLNVSTLKINCDIIPGEPNSVDDFEYAGLPPETFTVLSCLYFLRNLTSIKLEFPEPFPDPDSDWQPQRQKYRDDIMEALCVAFDQWATLTAEKSCPIQKLEIVQLGPEIYSHTPHLPNLTHLSLRIVPLEGDAAKDIYVYSTSAGANFVRHLIEPFCAALVSPTGWLTSFPKLEKFVLKSVHSYCPIGYEPYLDWDAITMPCLRELDLTDLVICTDSFENFLIRHAATLQRLRLINPQVLMYDEQPDKPDDREYKYGKKWYDIWKNLQDNLDHLIYLNVLLVDGTYCYYNGSDELDNGWQLGFQCEGNSDFLDNTGTNEPEKDAQVLSQFHATVEARRSEHKLRRE